MFKLIHEYMSEKSMSPYEVIIVWAIFEIISRMIENV